MLTVSGRAKPAHALVTAIRLASTPALKGEVIYREKWYLTLRPKPTPPARDAFWSDIRFSGLGEVLLDIVTQGAEGTGLVDGGEAHLQISALKALYHIVRHIQASWGRTNLPLEERVRTILKRNREPDEDEQSECYDAEDDMDSDARRE